MSERIKATDTARDVFLKLSEETPNGGAFNPGGLNVCMQIMEKGAKIDPDCPFPLLALLSFDTLGIYGSRIWMLYKDVCKQDLTATLGMLRGHQLGFITKQDLNHAIDNYGDGLDVEAVLEQVRERLPEFGRTEEATADEQDSAT